MSPVVLMLYTYTWVYGKCIESAIFAVCTEKNFMAAIYKYSLELPLKMKIAFNSKGLLEINGTTFLDLYSQRLV